ncbi:hypothetical protein ACOMHN_027260 [Nucella lapillus]
MVATVVCVVLLPLLFIPSDGNVQSSHTVLLSVIDAIERLIGFYKASYKYLNLDGFFGLKVVEGQIQQILEEHKQGQHNRLSLVVVQRLQSLLEDIRWIGERAIAAVRADDESYFNKMSYVIAQPWSLFKQPRKVVPSLRWDVPIYKASETKRLDEQQSDKCMMEITKPAQTQSQSQSRCSLSRECGLIMTQRGLTNYGITHQLLWTALAERAGCGDEITALMKTLGFNSTDHMQEEFCTNNFYEMLTSVHIFMSGKVSGDFQDMFMEQQFVCPSLGFFEFLKKDYLDQILSWQLPTGCFGEHSETESAMQNHILDDFPPEGEARGARPGNYRLNNLSQISSLDLRKKEVEEQLKRLQSSSLLQNSGLQAKENNALANLQGNHPLAKLQGNHPLAKLQGSHPLAKLQGNHPLAKLQGKENHPLAKLQGQLQRAGNPGGLNQAVPQRQSAGGERGLVRNPGQSIQQLRQNPHIQRKPVFGVNAPQQSHRLVDARQQSQRLVDARKQSKHLVDARQQSQHLVDAHQQSQHLVDARQQSQQSVEKNWPAQVQGVIRVNGASRLQDRSHLQKARMQSPPGDPHRPPQRVPARQQNRLPSNLPRRTSNDKKGDFPNLLEGNFPKKYPVEEAFRSQGDAHDHAQLHQNSVLNNFANRLAEASKRQRANPGPEAVKVPPQVARFLGEGQRPAFAPVRAPVPGGLPGQRVLAAFQSAQGSVRRLLVEKDMPGGCLSHKTGVACGALALYLRFLINPPPASSFYTDTHAGMLGSKEPYGNVMEFLGKKLAKENFNDGEGEEEEYEEEKEEEEEEEEEDKREEEMYPHARHVAARQQEKKVVRFGANGNAALRSPEKKEEEEENNDLREDRKDLYKDEKDEEEGPDYIKRMEDSPKAANAKSTDDTEYTYYEDSDNHQGGVKKHKGQPQPQPRKRGSSVVAPDNHAAWEPSLVVSDPALGPKDSPPAKVLVVLLSAVSLALIFLVCKFMKKRRIHLKYGSRAFLRL